MSILATFSRRALRLNHSRYIQNMLRNSSSSKPTSTIIAYATDVEGNYEYWKDFTSVSRAFRHDDDGKLILEDGY
eukprot:CAMPEP_0170426844 /NCGR_PEP_ID=MMETSP0117_2-20130122/38891_1 /TAXON_ID=400756 /ORGANISM="Durinskia baltica, Strain CSIRO CS-38" /LENGTH=74 /DNA_ID=CAMNT_0010685973 /DNA_START=45 /DNA_END=266 /DNA_ORIENTATION=+